MTTSGATVLAVLKEMTDPARLEEINGLMDSLDDKESVLVAREVAAGLARLEAVQYRALARLSVLRGGVRSVVQEVALALSVVDGYAGSMVATGVALTTRLPRTLSLMDRGELDAFRAGKVAEATAWLSDEDSANTTVPPSRQERELPPLQTVACGSSTEMKNDAGKDGRGVVVGGSFRK